MAGRGRARQGRQGPAGRQVEVAEAPLGDLDLPARVATTDLVTEKVSATAGPR